LTFTECRFALLSASHSVTAHENADPPVVVCPTTFHASRLDAFYGDLSPFSAQLLLLSNDTNLSPYASSATIHRDRPHNIAVWSIKTDAYDPCITMESENYGANGDSPSRRILYLHLSEFSSVYCHLTVKSATKAITLAVVSNTRRHPGKNIWSGEWLFKISEREGPRSPTPSKIQIS